MRVVLDANVYISALLSGQGHSARIVAGWLASEFEVVVSEAILAELVRVTGYERLQKKYARLQERRLAFIQMVAEQAVWVEPQGRLAVIAGDESDNRYLECAAAGAAQYVVSGDAHLLSVVEYQGILIMSPAAFITFLETGSL
jgi:uncharacterized protein